jgi:hypothetical protein
MQVTQNQKYLIGVSIILFVFNYTPVLSQELDSKVLKETAVEIQTKNQKVTPDLLVQDRTVIESSFPDIKTNFYTKGFTTTDMNNAVAAGWKDLRSPSSDLYRFDTQSFVHMVTKLGKLRIESTPTEANIEIDAKPQEKKTNTDLWFKPGTYQIVLTMDGYLPEKETRKIVEGNNLTINKTLKPKSE